MTMLRSYPVVVIRNIDDPWISVLISHELVFLGNTLWIGLSSDNVNLLLQTQLYPEVDLMNAAIIRWYPATVELFTGDVDDTDVHTAITKGIHITSLTMLHTIYTNCGNHDTMPFLDSSSK